MSVLKFKIHWTSLPVELAVVTHDKPCSRCKKFKSADQFYKQGARIESLCKQCKQEARSHRCAPKVATACAENEQSVSSANTSVQELQSYEDLGFTKDEFSEIVEFFQELSRMNMLRRSK
jgi:hypothetical protein